MNQFSRQRESIVSGSILKTVISLALPVSVGMLLEFALSVTDFYWVSKLGPSAQDSITSSMVVLWSVMACLATISIGITALVSRYTGAGDTDSAAHYIRQGIWLSLMLGLVLLGIGYLLTPTLLDFMAASPATSANAVPYLRYFFLATPIFALIEILYATYRASGDTKTPMRIGIIVVVINMLIDPALIFGIGPFPQMGVPGAGLGTLISIAIGLGLTIIYTRSGKLGYKIGRLTNDWPNIAIMIKITRIGLPIATQQFIFVAVYWVLIRIVHEFGESAGAAMGIGNRMESFSYLVTYGISIAASTMVGQNLGAGKPERAAKCAFTSVAVGIGITLVTSTLFLTIPGLISSVFTNDPEVHSMAVEYLVILGLSQFSMAIEIILEGAFSGSGDTLPPMIVAIPGALIRIPLAYWLAITLGWGLSGVWWTLTITTTLKAIVLVLWFRLGHWKLKQL